MILDIEFDSITLPHKKIQKTYNIPKHQKDLIKSITQFFDASERGMMIIPVNVMLTTDDEIKEVTVFISAVNSEIKQKNIINPRQKIDQHIKYNKEIKQESILRRIFKWLKVISTSLTPL